MFFLVAPPSFLIKTTKFSDQNNQVFWSKQPSFSDQNNQGAETLYQAMWGSVPHQLPHQQR